MTISFTHVVHDVLTFSKWSSGIQVNKWSLSGALGSYLVQESLGDEWQLGVGTMSNEYHFVVFRYNPRRRLKEIFLEECQKHNQCCTGFVSVLEQKSPLQEKHRHSWANYRPWHRNETISSNYISQHCFLVYCNSLRGSRWNWPEPFQKSEPLKGCLLKYTTAQVVVQFIV